MQCTIPTTINKWNIHTYTYIVTFYYSHTLLSYKHAMTYRAVVRHKLIFPYLHWNTNAYVSLSPWGSKVGLGAMDGEWESGLILMHTLYVRVGHWIHIMIITSFPASPLRLLSWEIDTNNLCHRMGISFTKFLY